MSKIPALMGGRALEHSISLVTNRAGGSSSKTYVGGQVHADTASGTTLTGTSTEGSLARYIIPANTLVAGSTIRIKAAGSIPDQNSTDTLTIRIRIGSSSTVTSNATAFVSAAIDSEDGDLFFLDSLITCRGVGATAAIIAINHYQDPDVAGTATKWSSAGGITVNTTAALYLDVTGDWSAADPDNQVNTEVFVVDIVNPI